MNLFIDLETLDIRPTAIVTELAAVTFSFADISASPEKLVLHPSIAHQLMLGRTYDAETIGHRLGNGTLNDETGLLGVTPEVAVDRFGAFIEKHEPEALYIWGKDFDRPILDNLFESVGRSMPIRYWDTHCARDAFYYAFRNTDRKPRKKSHVALADCFTAIDDLRDAIAVLDRNPRSLDA